MVKGEELSRTKPVYPQQVIVVYLRRLRRNRKSCNRSSFLSSIYVPHIDLQCMPRVARVTIESHDRDQGI